MAINVSTPPPSSNVAPPQESASDAQKVDQDKKNQEAAAAGDKKAKAQTQAKLEGEVKDAAGLKANAQAPNAKINDAVHQLQTLGAHKGPLPLAEFAALAQDATRPVAQAAPVLSTQIEPLDGKTPSVFTLLDQTEWKEVLTQLDPDAPQAPATQKPWAELVHRAVLKTEEGTFETLRAKLTPNMQHIVQQMTAAMKPTFVAYVSNATFRAAAPSPKDRVVKGAAASKEGGLFQTLPPIEIPSPALVAVEKLAKEAVSLEGGDIAELAQIVMMECAREAEFDLRDLLKQMQETNKKRKQMRDFIAAQKKQSAKASADLREQYDSRCSLPKGNDLRINAEITDFEAFKESQKLVRFGSLEEDNDGIPRGETSLGVSPNVVHYPQGDETALTNAGDPIPQATVAVARQLGLSAQKAHDLKTYWDANATKLAGSSSVGGINRFPSFAAWVLSPTSAGGVGLTMGAAEDGAPDEIASTFLREQHPDYLAAKLTQGYGLSETAAMRLAKMWMDKGPSFQRAYGNRFESFIEADPPSGPGFHESTASRPDSEVDEFLKGFSGDTVDAVAAKRWGISTSDLVALKEIHATGTFPGTFEAFLKAEQPLGPDLDKKDQNNVDAVRAFFEANTKKENMPSQVAWDVQNAEYLEKVAYDEDGLRMDDALVKPVGELAAIIEDQFRIFEHTKDLPRGTFRNVRDTQIRPKLAILSGAIGDDAFAAAIDAAMKEYTINYAREQWARTCGRPSAEHWMNQKKSSAAKLQDLLDSRPEKKLLASTYVHMQLRVVALEELSMIGERDYVDGDFMRSHFKTVEGTGWGIDHFASTGVEGGPEEIDWMNEQSHEAFARSLNVTIAVDLECFSMPEWGVQDLPPPKNPEATAPAPKGRLSQAERDRIELARKYVHVPDAQDAQALGDVPQQSAIPTDDFFKAAAKKLSTPPSDEIKQPGHIDVTGRELTLAQVDAEIEAWQAKYDSLGDMSQEQAMKLQIYQGRYSKFYEILSNMMKSISDLNKSLAGNLK